MAERLAGDLAARTGVPTPPGVPPAAYLAAVVQERQAREARRASGGRGADEAVGAGAQAQWVPGGGHAQAPQQAPVAPAGGSPWSAPGPDAVDGRTGAPVQQPFPAPAASAPVASQDQPQWTGRPMRPEPADRRPSTGFVPPA
jgi:hypothetical protein